MNSANKLTLKIGEQSVDVTLDSQTFTAFGLRPIGLLTAPQCWTRIAGVKLPVDREHEASCLNSARSNRT